jgi:hypothetical protein
LYWDIKQLTNLLQYIVRFTFSLYSILLQSNMVGEIFSDCHYNIFDGKLKCQENYHWSIYTGMTYIRQITEMTRELSLINLYWYDIYQTNYWNDKENYHWSIYTGMTYIRQITVSWFYFVCHKRQLNIMFLLIREQC